MNKLQQIKKYLYLNNLDGYIIPKNDIFLMNSHKKKTIYYL